MLSQGPPEHKLLTVITPTLEAPRHLLLAGPQGPSLPVITARMLGRTAATPGLSCPTLPGTPCICFFRTALAAI